jgi:hypothetical protein
MLAGATTVVLMIGPKVISFLRECLADQEEYLLNF